MGRYLTAIASFVIMICLGGVYAWSIIASQLVKQYGFSTSQSQIIFGLLIAVFPTTMIFVGRLGKKVKAKYIGYISGSLFFIGNIVASYSQGNFILVLLGIGLVTGIAIGFGYWISLTVPVQLFPEKKGFITGVTSAGFGLGAVIMSTLSEKFLSNGKNVLELFKVIGISYGLIIFLCSNLIIQNKIKSEVLKIRPLEFIKQKTFKKLFLGIFLGTFAGLLIIGNIKILGGQSGISSNILVFGVSLFAIANFLGRLFWGFIVDYIGTGLSVFIALLIQSIAIITLNIVDLYGNSYLLISFIIGFGFGGNFVLFARETAQIFGVDNLGVVYPYIFLGYAIAGITGPFIGGLIFDITGTYFSAIILSSLMSFAGSILFIRERSR